MDSALLKRKVKTFCKEIYENISIEPYAFLFNISNLAYSFTMKDMIYTNICYEKFGNLDFCAKNKTAKDDDYVQTTTSHWIMYNYLVYLFPASIGTLYLGSWSDYLGRKIPLVLTGILFTLALIGNFIWSLNETSAPLWVLLLIQIFSGFGGGEMSVLTLTTAYISNISTEKNRMLRLTILESSVILGATLGPIISGVITKNYSHCVVMIFSIICTILAVIYVCIFVKDIKNDFNGNNGFHSFHLKQLKEIIGVCIKPRASDKRKYILLCFAIIALVNISGGLFAAIFYLFLKDDPFNWSYEQFGIMEGITYFVHGCSLILIIPIFKKLFKLRDSTLGIIGCISYFAKYFLLGISKTDYTIYTAVLLGAFEICIVLACRSIITTSVDTMDEGKIISVALLIHYWTQIISKSIGGELWPLTRLVDKGIIFYCSATSMIFAVIIIMYINLRQKDIIVKTPEVHLEEL